MASSRDLFQRGRVWENPPPHEDLYGLCLICGRRLGSKPRMVLADISSNEVITADEREGREAQGSDVVEWGVGSECAKLPEVAPFVLR